MEVILSTNLSLPLIQIILLLSLSTLFLLFGRMKLALLTNYLFTLYWGYLFNRELLFNASQTSGYYITLYFGFGIVIAICALFGFLHSQE